MSMTGRKNNKKILDSSSVGVCAEGDWNISHFRARITKSDCPGYRGSAGDVERAEKGRTRRM